MTSSGYEDFSSLSVIVLIIQNTKTEHNRMAQSNMKSCYRNLFAQYMNLHCNQFYRDVWSDN